jgi:5-methylcytosine-specific restriction endonuclease McrA
MLKKIIKKINDKSFDQKNNKNTLYITRYTDKYNQWRRAVYKKDNYMCQICGRRGKLNAHHIFGFAKWKSKRFDINNGITLCSACHYKFHKKYGKSNFPNIKKLLKENKLKKCNIIL